jgi:hypothetical protein
VAPIAIAQGLWTGTTSQGRPITFFVQGRSITSITVGYTGSGCGLQLNETSQSDFAEPVAITPDNQFFASMPPPETLAGVGFVNGTFTAPTASSGRINFVILLISGFPCAINVDATWTATHP